MNSKIELLIQAVNDLKGNGSIAKDYIYPIVLPFLSAFVGVAAAKLTFRHQEKVRAEVSKVSVLNKLIIKMGEARSSLLGLKFNYKDLSETNFIKRALDIPPIIIGDYKVESNASDLSFLVDDDPDYTAAEYNKTWINIPRVGMMINNYHQVHTMLIKRNELYLDVLSNISSFKIKSGMSAVASMNYEQIIAAVGTDKLVAFCDLTQSFISLLDDVLFEINDFMFNFPEQARSKIELKLIKGYCKVLKYKTGGYEIKRTIEPDYEFIASFMGLTIDEAIGKYNFGFKRNE
ncbi:hypothetical protein [Serratia entomophila]|uniref:hypothetical protein n=1 Tax=Serratia entomophila TaxID=42906 RepID=UPI00217B2681|nr:hypothetical protein [Serratia entomophila]CAI0726999.1 Uncharacterised protein [Serratia entomophila]CAI1701400.1 Uncharacterised protein [Serratia entomophila]CAI2448203.1 Uncharacterised protein [Serratia entomophila]